MLCWRNLGKVFCSTVVSTPQVIQEYIYSALNSNEIKTNRFTVTKQESRDDQRSKKYWTLPQSHEILHPQSNGRHATVSLPFLKSTQLQLLVTNSFPRICVEEYLLDAIHDAKPTARNQWIIILQNASTSIEKSVSKPCIKTNGLIFSVVPI